MFFILFWIYFTVKFFKDLWIIYRLKVRPAKPPVILPGGRIQEDERSCFQKTIGFIGIDENRLIGQNWLVVIVLSLYMIVVHIIRSAIDFVRTVIAYSVADMLNFFELVNTVCGTYILILLAQIMLELEGDALASDNPDQLNNINMIAKKHGEVTFTMAVSVFCLCFRLLKLPSFSLEANLAFATLIEGKKDILNILMILLLFTEANSLAAFYIYSSTMEAFSTLTGSFYSVLKIYMGDFAAVPTMYAA